MHRLCTTGVCVERAVAGHSHCFQHLGAGRLRVVKNEVEVPMVIPGELYALANSRSSVADRQTLTRVIDALSTAIANQKKSEATYTLEGLSMPDIITIVGLLPIYESSHIMTRLRIALNAMVPK